MDINIKWPLKIGLFLAGICTVFLFVSSMFPPLGFMFGTLLGFVYGAIIFPAYTVLNFFFSFFDKGSLFVEKIAGISLVFLPLFVFLSWFVVFYILFFIFNFCTSFFRKSDAQSQVLPQGGILVNPNNRKKLFARHLGVVFLMCGLVFIGSLKGQRDEVKESYRTTTEPPQHILQRKNYAKTYDGEFKKIPELGIKIKIPTALEGFEYGIIEQNDERTVVGFSSSNLSKTPGCTVSDKALGAIYLYPKGSFDQILDLTSMIPYVIQYPDFASKYGATSYHPNYPYRFGDRWYFYNNKTFDHSYIGEKKEGEYIKSDLSQYYGYEHLCTENTAVATLQAKYADLLWYALATTFEINEPVE
jgi:hypothetical protein